MVKPELGNKRICVAFGTRFYDLTKSPAVCPKCGTQQPHEQPGPRRTGDCFVEDKHPKKQAPAPEDVDLGAGDLEDEEEDVLEAADELEDDGAVINDEAEPETDENEL